MRRIIGKAMLGSQKRPQTSSNLIQPETESRPPVFPDGIKLLHDDPDAIVDICFIHGLTGDRDKTWTAQGKDKPWPETLLPDKLRYKARILTYGYDAYVVRQSVASKNRLIDHATNLLTDLTTDRASYDASNRPLIFVAHSLGGLVSKEAILLSRDSPEAHLQSIFNHAKGIIFMGTPHQGAWMADWANIPVSALGLAKSTNKSLLTILETDNQFLESIQVHFLSMIRKLREDGKRLEVTCFFEELPLLGSVEVVSKASAILEGYNWNSLHSNHRDMTKFDSAEDNGFKRLLGELNRWESQIKTDSRGKIELELHSNEDLHDWLKSPDVDSIYLTVRDKHHGQTGQWFIKDELFCLWLEKGPSFLWTNGFVGCGKTHICVTAIDHLQNDHLRQREYVKLKTGVAYFFFDFNRSSQQDDCDMLRSLLWQLSKQLNDGHKQLRELRASKQKPIRDVLRNCLQDIMKEFSKVFILIDALDESPAGTVRATVLSTIKIMRKWNLPCLHLLVTSRDLADIRDSLNPQEDQMVIMKNAAIQQDIANYIGDRLATHIVIKKYKARHREIQRLISERSQCAFLYAVRLCDHIDTAASLSQLDELVSSLPGSLDAAYEDILSKIPKVQANDAGRILRILCLSSRPLTVNELIHALAVDLGPKPCLDIERRPFDINEIHVMLGCLVEVTSEKGLFTQECKIIQIAHLSVREYLESDEIRQQQHIASRFAINHSSAHMEIAQTCLLYILEPKISQREQSQDRLRDFPFASYAAKEWLHHYTSSDTPRSDVKKLVVELFMDCDSRFKTWVQLRDLGRSFKKTTATTPLYLACLLGLAEIAAELVKVYDVNAHGGQYGNALQAAISQGHIEVVHTLLDESPRVDFGQESSSAEQAILPERQETEIPVLANAINPININARGGEYGTSLIAASYNGNRELVLMLLRKGSNVNDQVGQYGNALAAASLKGHETVVQDLLKRNADLNAPGGKYGHALVAASRAGHSKIVQTLLLQDKSVSIHSQGEILRDSFYGASLCGHSNVLEVLLDSGADMDADDGQVVTALGAACLGGHMAAVQILIDHGANVNASSGRLGSALQAASLGGHIDLVEILLEKGANINASGGKFGNALQAASSGFREFMTQALQQVVQHAVGGKFSEGVLDLPQCSNALQVASLDQLLRDENMVKQISEIVVSKLLQEFSTGDYGILDPLLGASLIDRAPLVQLLLDKGAKVNATGGEYGSALQAASSRGLETVVKILLNAKADVQASGGLHGSALQLASNQKHQGIMKMLQEALPKGSPS